MNTGDRSPVLEEFDSLAGLPLDPPYDSEFRDALARQTVRRFGEDEYITTSSRPDPFRWISGSGIKAESCHRGFPGKTFKLQGSFCYAGRHAKTYALNGGGQLQLCLQTADTRTIGLSEFSTGDLDVVFGPEDRVAIIARIDGEVVCHDTISGEQRWKIPAPVIRRVPNRTIASVLFIDSYLNVLERALQRFSTLEVSPESLRHAELSARATSVLTLELGARSAAFSPDGTRIVTASWDNTSRIWDAAGGMEISRLSGHGSSVNSAVFSPDGTRIVTASRDNTARIWDAMTGAELACLGGHEYSVNSAVFSPDGTRIVTASSDRTVRVWDPFSASKVLTLGLDGAANLWDTCTGKRIAELGGKDDIRQARFSSCGRFLATADAEGLLRLCSSQRGDTLWQVRSGHRDIRAVFPLPGDDGIRILVGSHIETWRRGPDAGISAGHQRVSSVLSVSGWPLRFVTDLASLLDLDEKTLAGISSNGLAYDGLRSRVLHDGQKDPLTLHVPYGPLRAVHRKLRPGLEDLRARELGRRDLPAWRNAAAALSAHSGGPVTVSLRIGAYAELLSFGRVLAWMKSGPLQMGDDAATLLSRILTRSDHLAIRTRTAALLGELMTIDLTTRLAALGRDKGVSITRFSDRIFISGEDIPAGIGSFARTHREDIFVPGRLLSQAVSRSGFRLEAYGEVRGRISEPA
jgi:hypothetical protein